MKSLDFSLFVKFVGFGSIDFEGNSKPTIVTEFVPNRSLYFHIFNKFNDPIWNEQKKLIVIYEIVVAMTYLHDHGILHNDLKPSNVLLDENFRPKITDFGLSHLIKDSNDFVNQFKGTPAFIAPEVWIDGNYSTASDVYSFSMLLYEVVFMKRPYSKKMNHFKISQKVTNNERPLIPIDRINDPFSQLIQRCWNKNPKDRPSFKELMHEFQDGKYGDLSSYLPS